MKTNSDGARAMTALNNGEILFYGVVGEEFDNFTAEQVINQIDALGDVSEVFIRVNSVGGIVSHGAAILSYIRGHKARFTMQVDGVAVSMASAILMVADRVIMPSFSNIMIHNPTNVVWGDAR